MFQPRKWPASDEASTASVAATSLKLSIAVARMATDWILRPTAAL